MKSFYLHVLAEDHVVFRGDCVSIVVPIADGQYGIMANHSNMVSAIVPGEMHFTTVDGETVTAAVSGGIVKVEANDILVLVESAERPEEIDAARAKRAAEEARDAMMAREASLEYRAAQATLIRATNRLRVKRGYRGNDK